MEPAKQLAKLDETIVKAAKRLEEADNFPSFMSNGARMAVLVDFRDDILQILDAHEVWVLIKKRTMAGKR